MTVAPVGSVNAAESLQFHPLLMEKEVASVKSYVCRSLNFFDVAMSLDGLFGSTTMALSLRALFALLSKVTWMFDMVLPFRSRESAPCEAMTFSARGAIETRAHSSVFSPEDVTRAYRAHSR